MLSSAQHKHAASDNPAALGDNVATAEVAMNISQLCLDSICSD